MDAQTEFPVVILTGLSGAGKTTALRVFEDMGFFCVDGLPAGMVPKLVTLYGGVGASRARGIALGIDIRQLDFLKEWSGALTELSRQGIAPQLIFLESDLDVLMRRYAETRRPHPLESQDMGLRSALEEERRVLEPFRRMADLVLDTSGLTVHDLRRSLQRKWAFITKDAQGMRVHILSFGFKHEPPGEADMLFDLRFLPNPHFVESLRPRTGRDPEVAAYVLENATAREFVAKLLDFLLFLLPLYSEEGRYRLTIGFGCTGGKHRSVAVAELVFAELRKKGYAVTLEHRHSDRE